MKTNGNTWSIVNRVGLWVSFAALAAYVFYIGQWVGAADEKFNDAQTVEERQEAIKETIVTLSVNQANAADDVEEIKESQKEIEKGQQELNRKMDTILRRLEESE